MDALLLHPATLAVGYGGEVDLFLEPGGTLRHRTAVPSAPFVFTSVELIHTRLLIHAPSGFFLSTKFITALLASRAIYVGKLLQVTKAG